MLTYALFIATDPDPVSNSDWTHLGEVYDRARLSSGGTVVNVRATEAAGTDADQFDIDIATFVNGLQLEVHDDGADAFSYVADGNVIGTARRDGGQWLLLRAPEETVSSVEPVATVSAFELTREQAEKQLGLVVQDWLS